MVAGLAWWGASLSTDSGEQLETARGLLACAGTALAGVSSYLLYVLAVELGGAACVYCLTSAALSFGRQHSHL